ncbi:uncharacterized protein LOC117328460 [Pecten maximus]|uniref:uncharacterized protein LOC117328460 n=1 Tax=Pecten maximus TaxID=6579 RepID=UPI00145900D2|nr:uncharacterized protein LOC117328460 [Pecten maximus]
MASKSVFRAQIPIRVKGNVSCANHHGTEVSLCCRQCSELACIRCIASVHDGHVLDSLSEVIATKKGNIQSFIVRTEQNDVINLKTEVGSIAQKLEENESKFQLHQNELEKQGNQLKDAIDIIIKKSISSCTELKRENEKRLNKYKNDLETRMTDLTELVQKCRDTIESDCDVEIFDTEKELDMSPTVALNLCNMNFTPNMQPQGYLDLAMGRITAVGYQLNAFNVNEDDDAQSSMKTLKEVTQRKAPYNVSAICANKAQGAWICSSEVSSVYQLNDSIWRCGKEDCKVRVNDIGISPVTGNLWASSEENNAIIEIQTQGSAVNRFTTTSSPRCLCVTRDSRVIVGMARKLVCCDAHGDILLNKIVSTPTKVASCSTSGNLAVVELDFPEHEGKGKPHILVLDKVFKECYRFYNDREGKGMNPESSALNTFRPSDIVFDSAGNLLVGDYGNKSILILDTTGEVVKSIYSDSWHVVAMSINSEDSVWAVFRYRDYPNYKIKVLKPMY